MIPEGWAAWTVFHAAWLAMFAFARVAMHRARWDPRAGVAPAVARALPWILAGLYGVLGYLYVTMLVAARGNVAPSAVAALLAPQCAANFAAAWLAAGARRRAAGDPEPGHLAHERLLMMGRASASLLALWPAVPRRPAGFEGLVFGLLFSNIGRYFARRPSGGAFQAECTPLESEIMAITGATRALFVAGMKPGRVPRDSPFEMPVSAFARKPAGGANSFGHQPTATPARCVTDLDSAAATAALALSNCRVIDPFSFAGATTRGGSVVARALIFPAVLLGSMTATSIPAIILGLTVGSLHLMIALGILLGWAVAFIALMRGFGIFPSAAGVHRAAFRLWRSAYPAAARTAPMYAEALARRWAWARCIHRGDVLALHLIHEPGLRALMAACLGGHRQADAFFREAGPRAVEAVWGVTSQASASQL